MSMNNKNNVSEKFAGDGQMSKNSAGFKASFYHFKKSKRSFRVNSLEEVDKMTCGTLKRAIISGSSRKRLSELIKDRKISFLEAKRIVIKENFLRSQNIQSQKRPTLEGERTSEDKQKKGVLEVAVADGAYPIVVLPPESLVVLQRAVVSAMEEIPIEGPQVRFRNTTFRPGFMVFTCEDAETEEWLKGIVPSLKPWEDAALKILENTDDVEQHPCTCSTFVHDEGGQRLTKERILNRLRVSNRSLHTDQWTVWGTTPLEKGQVWTFTVDPESLEEIKKLNMQPYFGTGFTKFKMKTALSCQQSTFTLLLKLCRSITGCFLPHRLLVSSILSEYVKSGKSPTKPVKCIDVKGVTGICGLLWKKTLLDDVEVFINDNNVSSCKLIEENSRKNELSVNVLNKDPAIALHESGYSFVYIEINTEAVYYFDAAFRNISRNSVLVITTKDDPSLQGSNGDVAFRRYGGRIARTCYSHELAIRLVIGAMVRSAAKYNKGIKVLCSVTYKGSFTIAVAVVKNPDLANECLLNVRPLSHCMACEERKFHPLNNGYLIDTESKMPDCDCSDNAPSSTVNELGPIWAGELYDVNFVQGMLQHRYPSDQHLQLLLSLLLEEAICERGKKENEVSNLKKKARLDEMSPPFYYNLHRHHPNLQSQLSIASVINRLKSAGYRASRTHFNKLSIRTDANLKQLYTIMSDNKT